MQTCPNCKQSLAITLAMIVEPFFCKHCKAGPFKVNRVSGYLFALGLVAYFVVALGIGVFILNIDPADLITARFSFRSDATVASLFFILGFFV